MINIFPIISGQVVSWKWPKVLCYLRHFHWRPSCLLKHTSHYLWLGMSSRYQFKETRQNMWHIYCCLSCFQSVSTFSGHIRHKRYFFYHPAMAYSHMLSVLSATKTMWCWGAVAMNLVMTFSFWDLYLLDSGGMLDLGYEQTATHRLNRFWVNIEGDSNRNPNSRCFWVFAHKIHHPAHLASICRIHTLLFIG